MAHQERKSRSATKWIITIGVAVIVVIAIVWFARRPKLVQVTHPQHATLTETIASSARVGGIQESAIGAQFTGTVEHLYVKIGDRLKAGQPIATLKNDVTQQQKAQASSAVNTARARLVQISKPPLPSELDEATHQVGEARAQLAQISTNLQLAEKQFDRSQQLHREGLISQSDFDNAQSNLVSLRSSLRAANATVKARAAKLETLQKTPLPEDVQVAKAQLAEAEQALKVADQQSKDATITAPYNGVVTSLNAQEGQAVGTAGVINFVSDDLEIRVDLDENNLADLELGQKAVLSSSAFGDKSFEGTLTDLGAAVDEARGIITVKITPQNPPAWLRPGQTVNINLITNANVDRLIVPATAVLRQGSRSIVFAVENGHVVEKPVYTRPAVSQGIPIADGITESDDIVVNVEAVKAGQAVRIKRQP